MSCRYTWSSLPIVCSDKSKPSGFSNLFHLVKRIITTSYNGFGLYKVDSQKRIKKFVVKVLLLYLV